MRRVTAVSASVLIPFAASAALLSTHKEVTLSARDARAVEFAACRGPHALGAQRSVGLESENSRDRIFAARVDCEPHIRDGVYAAWYISICTRSHGRWRCEKPEVGLSLTFFQQPITTTVTAGDIARALLAFRLLEEDLRRHPELLDSSPLERADLLLADGRDRSENRVVVYLQTQRSCRWYRFSLAGSGDERPAPQVESGCVDE